MAIDRRICLAGSRCHPWLLGPGILAGTTAGEIDIRSYFASIDHAILKALLARKLKDPGLLALIGRIVDAHRDAPGKGLPIGALTSQQFANYYLAGLDRLLLEECKVRGMVRYMDDLVWWGDDHVTVRDTLAARSYTADRLALEIKEPVLVGRSRHGLSLCGYRILPGRLLLSHRRKRRYAECRKQWEDAYRDNNLGFRCARAHDRGPEPEQAPRT